MGFQGFQISLLRNWEVSPPKGSFWEEPGDAEFLPGRGVYPNSPTEEIAKSEVVVIWGKNITVTASHLMPYIEGKKLIVIDPVETQIAKRADLFLQITPRTDFYLAIYVWRGFAIMGRTMRD